MPEIFESSESAKSHFRSGTSVTIGNFDGVHFGHQVLLKSCLDLSKKHQSIPTVLTFEPHPVAVLAPEFAPKQISSKTQKIQFLKQAGITAIVFEKFTKDFAKMSPETFFQTILVENLNAKSITIGHDFTFGSKRSGNIETLQELCDKHHIELKIVEAQMLGETLVSSTLIRRLITAGDVRLAKDLLTRPFEISGHVVSGHKRGTSLGIHTANLASENELIPSDGVYVVRIQYENQDYDGVCNIGYNPTFANAERSIEAHLFNFEGELYGKNLSLKFLERLRNEIRFATPEALVTQIKKDILEAQKILAKEK